MATTHTNTALGQMGGNLMVRGLKMQMHLKLQACLFFSLFFLLYTDGETLSKLIMTHHQHQHHIRTNGGGTMFRGLEMQMHLAPGMFIFFPFFFLLYTDGETLSRLIMTCHYPSHSQTWGEVHFTVRMIAMSQTKANFFFLHLFFYWS